MFKQGSSGSSRLLKTSVQLTPTLVAWLESNPLGIEGRGSTPSATIRTILEQVMEGGIRPRADRERETAERVAELTERVEKLEALAANTATNPEDYPADYVNPAKYQKA